MESIDANHYDHQEKKVASLTGDAETLDVTTLMKQISNIGDSHTYTPFSKVFE